MNLSEFFSVAHTTYSFTSSSSSSTSSACMSSADCSISLPVLKKIQVRGASPENVYKSHINLFKMTLTLCLGGHRGADEQDWRHLWRKKTGLGQNEKSKTHMMF